MIQLNLLPDVKIQFIKARLMKRLVMIGCSVIAGVSIASILFLFLYVDVREKKNLVELDKKIGSSLGELKSIKNIDKILTIQNQLGALPALHEAKPVASRIFGYLQQLTPLQVTIAKINMDFEGSKIDLEGAADKLETVNKFVDTLKFTKYSVADGDQGKKAFTSVVLETFSRDSKNATYKIRIVFDKNIFVSSADVAKPNNITLSVPAGITSRSETERPTALFDPTTLPATAQPTAPATTGGTR
jgi:hypothetical protein